MDGKKHRPVRIMNVCTKVYTVLYNFNVMNTPLFMILFSIYNNNDSYCDLRGRIKGTARALYPVFVERALWPILSVHKAR